MARVRCEKGLGLEFHINRPVDMKWRESDVNRGAGVRARHTPEAAGAATLRHNEDGLQEGVFLLTCRRAAGGHWRRCYPRECCSHAGWAAHLSADGHALSLAVPSRAVESSFAPPDAQQVATPDWTYVDPQVRRNSASLAVFSGTAPYNLNERSFAPSEPQD
eukprot:scaffold66916_cov34-Phaeocystis_antarctica.AAC.1